MTIGKTIITIDPGISGTGVALWDYNLFRRKHELCIPLSHRSMAKYILSQIHSIIVRNSVVQGYMENQHYMDSGQGDVCARSGALVKLSQFAGQIIGVFNEHHLPIELVDVQKWKGTISKDLVKHRILKRIPDCKATNHDWDAIGIGLYKMGRF